MLTPRRFGLYAAVYTKDINRAIRFAKGLEAGTVDAVFAAVSADRYLFVGFQRVPPLVDGDAVELLDFLGRVFRGHDAP